MSLEETLEAEAPGKSRVCCPAIVLGKGRGEEGEEENLAEGTLAVLPRLPSPLCQSAPNIELGGGV